MHRRGGPFGYRWLQYSLIGCNDVDLQAADPRQSPDQIDADRFHPAAGGAWIAWESGDNRDFHKVPAGALAYLQPTIRTPRQILRGRLRASLERLEKGSRARRRSSQITACWGTRMYQPLAPA